MNYLQVVQLFRRTSPDIVEAILDDKLPDHLTLFDIAVDPPALWEGQMLRSRDVLIQKA